MFPGEKMFGSHDTSTNLTHVQKPQTTSITLHEVYITFLYFVIYIVELFSNINSLPLNNRVYAHFSMNITTEVLHFNYFLERYHFLNNHGLCVDYFLWRYFYMCFSSNSFSLVDEGIVRMMDVL